VRFLVWRSASRSSADVPRSGTVRAKSAEAGRARN
jgi:putative transposase